MFKKNICCVLEGLVQRLSVLKILWLCHDSPGSHLQVDVSDPFDDAMRRPNQWIHILVLTLYPTGLQGLEVKQVDVTLKYFLPHIWSWEMFWIYVLFLPPCRTGAVGAVRCQAAGWPGGTSYWCWGGVQGHGGSASSACAHPRGDCGRPGSTGEGPRRSTRPWPPSGDPDLQPWTTCFRANIVFLDYTATPSPVKHPYLKFWNKERLFTEQGLFSLISH